MLKFDRCSESSKYEELMEVLLLKCAVRKCLISWLILGELLSKMTEIIYIYIFYPVMGWMFIYHIQTYKNNILFFWSIIGLCLQWWREKTTLLNKAISATWASYWSFWDEFNCSWLNPQAIRSSCFMSGMCLLSVSPYSSLSVRRWCWEQGKMPMSHNNRGDTSGLCAVFVSSISSEIRGIIQYCLETMPCIVPKYLVSLSTNVWPFGWW